MVNNNLTDGLISEVLYMNQTLENPRHGVFFQYDPETGMEVATVHRLRPESSPASEN